MPERLPSVDVVLVGFGWTAAILAQELTQDGLEVLAIERGGWRDTPTDFPTTHAPDELRYYWRHDMFLETAIETQTFRNNRAQTALPIRRWGSYLPGVGVGGAGVHWNGQTFRPRPIRLPSACPPSPGSSPTTRSPISSPISATPGTTTPRRSPRRK